MYQSEHYGFPIECVQNTWTLVHTSERESEKLFWSQACMHAANTNKNTPPPPK